MRSCESTLLQAACITLADAPCTPVERDVLTAVGTALTICSEDMARLPAAARTPFRLLPGE